MQRDQLRQLLERTPDPAFVLTPDGLIWFWNRRAEALLGYEAEDAVGRPFSALLHAHGPLGRDMGREYCQRAIQDGGATSFDVEVLTRVGAHTWVNLSVLVLEELRNSPALVVHLAHDITASRHQRALYERVIEAARDVVQLADEEHHLLPISPLTEQEIRILHAFADGHTTNQVARKIGVSTSTLRNHLYHVNQKLGTHSRLQAVMHAVRRHLI